MKLSADYGKAEVSVYRTYATPLPGVRDNVLFATEVSVNVFGESFLAAYTEGDNSMVVATDTMKNFVYTQALEFPGATLEGFLAFTGRRFLETYPQMSALRVHGRERPFSARGSRGVLFARSGPDHAVAEVELSRGAGGAPAVTSSRSGREGMALLKITGSSFTRFVRDRHTTLPETVDRPLFIGLDAHWRYGSLDDAASETASARYVHADHVRDELEATFDEFNSRSIQHLVHEMGRRVLDAHPQLSEMAFEAQNRIWETARASGTDERVKVYTDPHPTYGRIGLVVRR